MKSRALLLGVFVLLAGCKKHILTDYRPLDQAGMWSSGLEELKKLDTSDSEVAQLVKAKQARLSDDACVALVAAAHERKHPFASGDSTANLARAGYSEAQILDIAQADQLDAISGDAVGPPYRAVRQLRSSCFAAPPAGEAHAGYAANCAPEKYRPH